MLGSGGSKGAFEAGAVYHLVVHRGCDFTEISGTSVGALNGALLAQAPRSDDPATSLASLRASAESLVEAWGSIRTRRDVLRSRPLGRLRFALFGLDSVYDFTPLRTFIGSRVDLERLAAGRELRIGTMSFHDGRYREVLINRSGRVDPATALDFVFASAMVPVFGRMPVIAAPGDSRARQFSDGGVRHATPVRSYFQACERAAVSGAALACVPLTGADTPPHPHIEQLFVVVTSPHARSNDARPIFDPEAVDRRSGHVEDGRKILVRMFDLLIDTLYRDDLDDMLLLNELLASQASAGAPPAAFSLGSFHREGDTSLPYEIAVVAPQREDADPMSIFNVTPPTQRRELYCGCIAADTLMLEQYGLASQADRCTARFPGLPAERRDAASPLEPAVCRDERTAVD